MYVAAIVTGYLLVRRRLRRDPASFPPETFEIVFPWIILGIVVWPWYLGNHLVNIWI